MMLKAVLLCTLLALAAARPADDKKEVDKKTEVKVDAMKKDVEKVAALKTEEKKEEQKVAAVKTEVVKKEDVKVEPVKEEVKVVADEPKKDAMKDEAKDVLVKVADAVKAAADETKKEAETEVKAEEEKKEDKPASDEVAKQELTTRRPGISGLFSGIRQNAAAFAQRINPFSRRRTAAAANKETEAAKPAESAEKEPESEKEAEKVADAPVVVAEPEKKEKVARRSISGVMKTVAKEVLPLISNAVEAYAAAQRPQF